MADDTTPANDSTPSGASEEWIGTSDAAQRIGASERRVRYLIEREQVRARKVPKGGRDVWEVFAEDLAEHAQTASEPRSEENRAIVAQEATRAAVAALGGFLEHVDSGLDREAEERRSAVSEVRADLSGDLRDLREALATQSEEIRSLRRDLEEARRPWYRRILRGREEADNA